MITRITEKYGFWPEAVQDVNEWLYFDRKDARKEFGDDVRAYFDELMPTDPVELVVLYTHGWQTDFHDPDRDYNRDEKSGHDFDYASRKAVELADQIIADPALLDRTLDRLVTSEAKTVFSFAHHLAELATDPVKLFQSALAKAKASPAAANRQFFGGLIAGADIRDPLKARDCVRVALKSPKLKDDAISMIGAGKLQPSDIELVVSLLQSGDVEPHYCASLSYGRGMEHLSARTIIPLLDELTRHGAEGHWSALDIITMTLHGGIKPKNAILERIKSILVAPELFDQLSRSTMDGYHLQEMVGLLDKNGAIDAKFARALVEQLFSICDRERYDHNVFFALDDPVRNAITTLIPDHPKEVWRGAARNLTSTDMLTRDRFEDLVGANHRDHLAAGLLFDVPSELYLDWVRKDPPARASFVIEWLPIVVKGDDVALSWHPVLESYIAEFVGEKHILSKLATRLHPRSWSGSLVPQLEPLVTLLESWRSHKNPDVRQWAQSMIDGISGRIEEEGRRAEEDVVRY